MEGERERQGESKATLEIIFAHPNSKDALSEYETVYVIPQKFMTWTDKDQYIGTNNLMRCTGIVLHYPAKQIGCAAHVEADTDLENYINKMVMAVGIMENKINDLKTLSGDPQLEIVIIGGQSNPDFRRESKNAIMKNFPRITHFTDTYDLSFDSSEGLISAEKIHIGKFAYNPRANKLVIADAFYLLENSVNAKKRQLIEVKGGKEGGKGCCVS